MRIARERLRRIRNWQSKDWYAAVFVRPLAILVMLVIADWRWVTPNLLTTAANLAKIAAAALIAAHPSGPFVLPVILLQLGLLFDHLDGTLARYRGTSSSFGSYYDKISDAGTWFPIHMAVGWAAYRRSGDGLDLVVAAVGAYCLLGLGYSKWVIAAEKERAEWEAARIDPAAAVARKLAPRGPSGPPERTVGQWLKWFGWSMVQIVRFEEVDLFFWVGLFLIWNRHLDWLLWMLAVTQAVGMLGAFALRAAQAHKLDLDRRA